MKNYFDKQGKGKSKPKTNNGKLTRDGRIWKNDLMNADYTEQRANRKMIKF